MQVHANSIPKLPFGLCVSWSWPSRTHLNGSPNQTKQNQDYIIPDTRTQKITPSCAQLCATSALHSPARTHITSYKRTGHVKHTNRSWFDYNRRSLNDINGTIYEPSNDYPELDLDEPLPLVSIDSTSDDVEADSWAVLEDFSASANKSTRDIHHGLSPHHGSGYRAKPAGWKTLLCLLLHLPQSLQVGCACLCARVCASAGVRGIVSPRFFGFKPIIPPREASCLFYLWITAGKKFR